jgi:Zn-dependent protease with chaperone function
MLINDERCCNLFSIKRNGRAVIFLGRGAWEKLEPDELRAALAHEMPHIHYGDAEVNTLTAACRAINDLSLTGFGYIAIPWVAIVAFVIYMAILAALVGLAVAVQRSDSAALVILAAFLPLFFLVLFEQTFTTFLSYILRQRDRYADELAVKWTLQPESLIHAMQKAQAYDESERIAFLNDMPFVPAGKQPETGAIERRIQNLQSIAHLEAG